MTDETDRQDGDVECQILGEIDRQTGYTVGELADRIGTNNRHVQKALESLMERGKITSTPDWRYRLARRSSEDDSGLYGKYEVRRDGDPVEACFVLEPESDPSARHALSEYARHTDDTELANDLRRWIGNIASGGEGDRNE